MCGSVGFEQAETVVGTLRTVSEAFQHAEIGDVEGGGKQVTHLTHKLGQNDLFFTKQEEEVCRLSANMKIFYPYLRNFKM